MICCSIQNKGIRPIEAILKKVEMAEIRLDLCSLTDEQIERLFSSDVPLIATCRVWSVDPSASNVSQSDAERMLALAIRSGAHYVDLEIEAPKPVSKRLAQACREWGTVMIRSYHNLECTPSLDDLRAMVDKCRQHDGQVVKVVTTALNQADADRVMSLYKYYTPDSLVAFAMAQSAQGQAEAPSAAISAATRVECLAKGAPFSYCALTPEEATAPGQLDYDTMYAAVYKGRKAFVADGVRMPASKSYAQRAILASALADGTSTLTGYTDCGDSLSAIEVAKALGATVVRKRGQSGTTTLSITGIAAQPGSLDAPQQPSQPQASATLQPTQPQAQATSQSLTLNVGESGLLTRLAIPLACQLSSQPVEIQGCGTLLTRPLQGLPQTMEALGATVGPAKALGATIASAPSESLSATTVPLTVRGPLRAGLISVDGSKTSQLVSGAVMALPLSERNSTIKVQNPTSIPYLYMTLDILRKFGIKVRSEMYGGRKLLDDDWSKCTEIVLKIRENQRYKAADLAIEGDWSAATVFLAAGAIFGSVTLEGLDTTSLQADLCMLDLLMDAGASLSQIDEPTGTISVRKAPLAAISTDLSNSPDLFPVATVTCAFCQGRSTLRGVHRLVHKESDRAAGILEMLTKLGVRASIKGDDLIIDGESYDTRILSGHLLKGGDYSSGGDHRMVMALRLAGLGAETPINVDNTECVAKSFPDFNAIWNEYIR